MRLRVRVGLSCITITCAGAGIALLAACVGDDDAQPAQAVDASVPDTSQPNHPFDSGPSPSDAGSDTNQPPVDAGPDAPQGVDAACPPGSIAGFTPPPYMPIGLTNGSCTNVAPGNPDAGALFDDDCVADASASFAACNAFLDAAAPGTEPEGGSYISPACMACLVTPEDGGTDGGYGPVIVGRVAYPNLAGCIAIADETDAGVACAAAIQAATACSEYACNTGCGAIVDDTTRNAYLDCLRAATSTVCATYALAASQCIAVERGDGGPNPDTVNFECFDSDAGDVNNLLQYFCFS